jgi:hypothetical protein
MRINAAARLEDAEKDYLAAIVDRERPESPQVAQRIGDPRVGVRDGRRGDGHQQSATDDREGDHERADRSHGSLSNSGCVDEGR